MNAAVAWTLIDRLNDLGGIAADRVRLQPQPGSATVADLLTANASHKPLIALTDQTPVEKTK